MKNKMIVFTGVNKAELLDCDVRALQDGDVLVETVVSTISCGTEKANITGNENVGIGRVGVTFPRHAGYSSSGIVVAKGKDVTDLEIGDRVIMSWSLHQKYNCIPASRAVKIEDPKVSFEDGALFQIATFPMAAIRKTHLEIGESMMVMGLGILGLMAVQLAHLAGAAPVIAVDPVAERREKALRFGADYALDPFEEGFADQVKALTGGGVKTAIEVTGLGAGLNQTLDCMARFGRVALLGCTRDKHFYVDYYHKVHGPGIQLIGAHTMARPSTDSSSGLFTERDDVKAILKLSELGRLKLDRMVDRTCLPSDCASVYTELINDRHFPTVVQFDWRNE